MIWTCLAEQAIFPNDREQCFRWFAEVKNSFEEIFILQRFV
jgi:hypothetical protein